MKHKATSGATMKPGKRGSTKPDVRLTRKEYLCLLQASNEGGTFQHSPLDWAVKQILLHHGFVEERNKYPPKEVDAAKDARDQAWQKATASAKAQNLRALRDAFYLIDELDRKLSARGWWITPKGVAYLEKRV